jgi:hypothetical protein
VYQRRYDGPILVGQYATTMSAQPAGVSELLDRTSIVLKGSFNPTIFQPAWFARHGLLRDTEADEAQVQIVHQQISDFKTGWLQVQATRDRFVAVSLNGGYEAPLLDFVISTFTLLEHTPLSHLGMNREVQLQFDSIDRWHRFGHTLVPKGPWPKTLKNPGLLRVTIQGERQEPGAFVTVTVTSTGERRADIDINDHRAAQEHGPPLLPVLRESWEEALAEGRRIVDDLLGLIN